MSYRPIRLHPQRRLRPRTGPRGVLPRGWPYGRPLLSPLLPLLLLPLSCLTNHAHARY